MIWGATVADLAGYLRREIKDRQWTQREAAGRLGISKTALTGLLDHPDRVPELETLKKIADGLDVSLRSLLQLCGYSLGEAEATEREVYGLTSE